MDVDTNFLAVGIVLGVTASLGARVLGSVFQSWHKGKDMKKKRGDECDKRSFEPTIICSEYHEKACIANDLPNGPMLIRNSEETPDLVYLRFSAEVEKGSVETNEIWEFATKEEEIAPFGLYDGALKHLKQKGVMITGDIKGPLCAVGSNGIRHLRQNWITSLLTAQNGQKGQKMGCPEHQERRFCVLTSVQFGAQYSAQYLKHSTEVTEPQQNELSVILAAIEKRIDTACIVTETGCSVEEWNQQVDQNWTGCLQCWIGCNMMQNKIQIYIDKKQIVMDEDDLLKGICDFLWIDRTSIEMKNNRKHIECEITKPLWEMYWNDKIVYDGVTIRLYDVSKYASIFDMKEQWNIFFALQDLCDGELTSVSMKVVIKCGIVDSEKLTEEYGEAEDDDELIHFERCALATKLDTWQMSNDEKKCAFRRVRDKL